jgi:hypothetical protein
MLDLFSSASDPCWFQYGSGATYKINADPDPGSQFNEVISGTNPDIAMPITLN